MINNLESIKENIDKNKAELKQLENHYNFIKTRLTAEELEIFEMGRIHGTAKATVEMQKIAYDILIKNNEDN